MPLSSSPQLHRIFPGDSEMAMRMRAHDWSATELGPPQAWPDELRVALGICLGSRFPLNVWWGRDLTLFYNDGYIPFLGAGKHPHVLGQSGRLAWAEVWHQIGPMIDRVLTQGQASWSEDILMFFNRGLPQEEVYVTFSFSPIFDRDGHVAGLFCACTEVTSKMLAARRLESLRRLGVESTVARGEKEACEAVVSILADNPFDVPFAAVYLADGGTGQARLAALTAAAHWTPPSLVSLNETEDGMPFKAAQDQRRLQRLGDLSALGIAVPLPPWGDGCKQAVLLPLAGNASTDVAGFLLAGVSPRRPVDDHYLTFYALAASHIATAIAHARAYEAERQRAEALAEIDRVKTTFFGNISHEFRTPLTLLLAPLEDAMKRQPDPNLEMVHRNAMRLLRLVNSLLDFARLEAGRLQACFEPVDLARDTLELTALFRAAIEGAGLRFDVDCATLPEPVYIDREKWEQIVLNLLSNALKFCFKGRIGVSLGVEDGRAVLHVSDTGVGIGPADLGHVFDRFYRASGTRSRTHEGAGIGLSMVRELVRLHGGSVSVQSAVDLGTVFTIALPFGAAHLPAEQVREGAPRAHHRHAEVFVSEARQWLALPGPAHVQPEAPPQETDEAGPPELASARPHRARILIADDNADMRQYLGRLLSTDHDVVCVADGHAALAEARARLPDLVLSDVMMPGVDGFGLLHALREDERSRAVPIILLSARAGEAARAEGLDAGADDYLIKPFSALEVRARVAAHLRLHRMREDMATQLSQQKEASAQEARRHKAQALRDFMAHLGEALRGEDDPEAIKTLAIEMLHMHLGAKPEAGRPWPPEEQALMADVNERILSAQENAHNREAMREREQRISLIADLVPDLLWSTDPQGVLEWQNSRLITYIGHALPLTAACWTTVVHEDDVRASADQWRQSLAEQTSLSVEHRIRSAQGEYRWHLIRSEPLRDASGQVIRWIGAAIDIHEQRCARDLLERRVRERTCELERASAVRRELLLQRESLQDDERRRIARDLHDALGQQLTAAALALGELAQQTTVSEQGHLSSVRRMLQSVDLELDRIVFQLRPTALEDCGLAEGIHAHAHTWSVLAGIQVDMMASGMSGERLPLQIEAAVFRVVQEALTNVAKHARADAVAIAVERVGGQLIVSVEDNGVGFDQRAEEAGPGSAPIPGWGLLGMKERIEALGGQFSVESAIGAGTTVLLRVPCPQLDVSRSG